MSYKHNNLMAMRQNYWNDTSLNVQNEKAFFQKTLLDYDIFQEPSLDDAKYLFFSFPSIIIVKGYALGFTHEQVKSMIVQHIQEHKMSLQNKMELKIQYKM